MGIQCSHPLLLLLLIPCAAWLYWMWRSTLRLSGRKKALAVGVRALVLLLLVLSLAGAGWYDKLERQAVVWVVDRSDSVGDNPAVLAWMQEAAHSKGSSDLTGVVSVGLAGAVEKSPDERDLSSLTLNAQTNRQFTNLASGLQLAESLLPDDASPRLVLVSDGNENVGDVLKQGELLKNRGIPVDVLPIPSKAVKDAAVEDLKIPEKLYQGEKFTAEVRIASTAATAAELRIYEDNREIAAQQVQLEQGENRFALQSLASAPGFHRYRAEVYADGDGQAANDAGYAFSRVAGPPKVLVVEGEPGVSGNLTRMLDAGFIPYDVIAPELLPRELTDYTGYESIILNNVPATRISSLQMELIEQSVRDYGVGLVMTGGEDSFGMGGYFQTPIERALPVYMDLRGKRQIPSLGLILVIDKSGSMSGDKMKLAQEAAARTVDLLRDQDTIGVLAFDNSPWWVVEPQKVKDRKKVNDSIASIQADGGTEVYSAVEEAYRKMLKVDAQRKHIILLTDGQSATQQSYDALAADMVKNNITLSSVAIGEDADQALLARIAELAKGRFYYTNDQSTIPAIFSRETVMMSRTYIVDQPFVPAFGQGADWSALFGQGVPPIRGYIATTPKETAEVSLASPEPDPLLARWQYGAGRAVAWTSDVSGKWSADWVAWSEFPRVFSQIVKWTFPQFDVSPLEISSHLRGDEVTLDVKSGVSDFQGDLRAVITDEALNSRQIQFTPTVPGEYTSQLTIDQPGAYLARLDVLAPDDRSAAGSAGSADGGSAPSENGAQPGNGPAESGSAPPPRSEQGADAGRKVLGSVTEGFVVPYSPEYRITAGDQTEKLRQLAEMTGGRVLSLDHPEEVFRGEVTAKKRFRDLSDVLLKLALLLWVVDIAARRLTIPWSRLLRLPLRRRRAHPEAGDGRATAPEAAARESAAEAGAGGSRERLSRLKDRTRQAEARRRSFAGVGAGSGDAAAPGGAAGSGETAPAGAAVAPEAPASIAESPAQASPGAGRQSAPQPASPPAPPGQPAAAGGRPQPASVAKPPGGPAASGAPPEAPPQPSAGDRADTLNRLLAAKERLRKR